MTQATLALLISSRRNGLVIFPTISAPYPQSRSDAAMRSDAAISGNGDRGNDTSGYTDETLEWGRCGLALNCTSWPEKNLD